MALWCACLGTFFGCLVAKIIAYCGRAELNARNIQIPMHELTSIKQNIQLVKCLVNSTEHTTQEANKNPSENIQFQCHTYYVHPRFGHFTSEKRFA